MPFALLNAVLLAGLVAVVVPPLIHLFTRRRFDVAPWAAMQFLEPGHRTRRRVFLDEWLLMAVRMALIALIAVGLAAPVETAGWLAWGDRSAGRDFALVVDQSGSMVVGLNRQTVLRWFDEFRNGLNASDRVAVIRAGPAATVVLPLTADIDAVRSALNSLPEPRGGCNSPATFALARQILAQSQRPKSIVALTDGQRHGWADPATEQRWVMPSPTASDRTTDLVTARLAPDRPADLVRWQLQPIRAARALALAERPVVLRSELQRLGNGELPRPVVRLFVDGEPAGVVEPAAGGTQAGQPIEVRRSFSHPGSHWISHRLADANGNEIDRQDLAIEVVAALPVLVVDGDARGGPDRHGVEFLREALAPARDPSPGVIVRVVSSNDFDPRMLTRDLRGPGTKPAALVLADVARLKAEQSAAVAAFLDAGGGVLVTLGERADASFYTQELYRGGRGWLPAAVGPWTGPGDLVKAAQPMTGDMLHSALELFRGSGSGTLADARFARWRTLTPAGNAEKAATIARLTGDMPLLVEGRRANGRVIVAAVPFDDAGPSNVVELPAYAPLIHELIAYLSGSRTAGTMLAAGQPFVWSLPADVPAEGWTLTLPDSSSRTLTATDHRIVIDDTWLPGAYVLRNDRGPVRYFVVADDAAEANLTPLDDQDLAKLQKWLPGLRWVETAADVFRGAATERTTDMTWLAFAGVIALLCTELWMTRRRALSAAGDSGQSGQFADGPFRRQEGE